MKRVCAWCGKSMGEKPGGPGTTHGICDECRAEIAGQEEPMEPEDAIEKCLSCKYHTRAPEEGTKVDFIGCTQGVIPQAADASPGYQRALSWIRRRDKVYAAILECQHLALMEEPART